MNLMIASDIPRLRPVLPGPAGRLDREGADRLLLLGDLLYHGPRNDLPDQYAPKEVIALLNERKSRLLCVRATVRQRWTRWCWNSPSWPTTPYCGRVSG